MPSSLAQSASGRSRLSDALGVAVQVRDVPLLGIGLLGHVLGDEVLDHLVAHVAHRLGDVLGLHQLAPLLVDDLALVVHHVVELEQLLADLEVVGLDLLLRLLQRLVDPGMDDRLAFLEAEALQHPVHALGAEAAHQIVLEAQEELRAAGIALAAGAAAQLVVDAPALVALGADDEQAAGVHDALALGLDLGADRLGLRTLRAPRPAAPAGCACRHCRRAGCRCRGRPCWSRWSPRPPARPGR